MNLVQPLAAITALACLGSCITVNAPSNPVPLPLPSGMHALQTHEFESDGAVVMSSVMDVLQDLGYILETVDPNAGFITASGPERGESLLKPHLIINGEPVIATTQNHVTAVLEEVRPGVISVRLNFVVSKRHDGESFTTSRDESVFDPQTYQMAFDKIGAAIAARVLEQPAAEPPRDGGDQGGGGDRDHPREHDVTGDAPPHR